jgi:hypothetical protein
MFILFLSSFVCVRPFKVSKSSNMTPKKFNKNSTKVLKHPVVHADLESVEQRSKISGKEAQKIYRKMGFLLLFLCGKVFDLQLLCVIFFAFFQQIDLSIEFGFV